MADLGSEQEKNADRRQTKNSFIAGDETRSCVVSLGQECLYLLSLSLLTYTHTHKFCQPQNIAGIMKPERSQEVGSDSISARSGPTPGNPNPAAWPDTLTLLDLCCTCMKSAHKRVIFLAKMTSWKVINSSCAHWVQVQQIQPINLYTPPAHLSVITEALKDALNGNC